MTPPADHHLPPPTDATAPPTFYPLTATPARLWWPESWRLVAIGLRAPLIGSRPRTLALSLFAGALLGTLFGLFVTTASTSGQGLGRPTFLIVYAGIGLFFALSLCERAWTLRGASRYPRPSAIPADIRAVFAATIDPATADPDTKVDAAAELSVRRSLLPWRILDLLLNLLLFVGVSVTLLTNPADSGILTAMRIAFPLAALLQLALVARYLRQLGSTTQLLDRLDDPAPPTPRP